MRLRTVTLSPGFDHTVIATAITPGGVAPLHSWIVEAAGKGVNVARTAALLGVPVTAYSLIGAEDRDEFARLIEHDGVTPVLVAVPGSTRRNLTLLVPGTLEPASHAVGGRLKHAADEHADLLLQRLLADVEPGDLVTLNGGVPPNIRETIWVEAAQSLHERGARVIFDVQGDPLLAALQTGIAHMAKPNEEESAVLPVAGTGLARAANAVAHMQRLGVTDPIVTLGDAGCVHTTPEGMRQSACAVAAPKRLVGAGDAFIAGYCAALVGGAWQDGNPVALALATAAEHVAMTSSSEFAEAVRGSLSRVVSEPVT